MGVNQFGDTEWTNNLVSFRVEEPSPSVCAGPALLLPSPAYPPAEADIVKVKISAPVQVVHEGARYTIGQTADVPDQVAQDWIRQGWVTEAKAAAPRKRSG
jgi:hypothetical protein